MNCKKSVTLRAPGKINLSLSVTGRRADGYHTIDTVMHETGLCDVVTVSLCGRGISVSGTDGIARESNLAYRAAGAYLKARLGAAEGEGTPGVTVEIEKHIPVSGGMAGGSADAAAVLRALDSLIGGVGEETLGSIALSLGADVPFCLAGGAMHCTGIGEVMTPCRRLPPHRLMVVGDCGVKRSTARMYAELDGYAQTEGAAEGRESAEEGDAVRDAAPYADCIGADSVLGGAYVNGTGAFCSGAHGMLQALDTGELRSIAGEMSNVFELVNPACTDVKRLLTGNGALGALLCGSGPSVFGLFEYGADVAAAEEAVRAAGYTVLYVGDSPAD